MAKAKKSKAKKSKAKSSRGKKKIASRGRKTAAKRPAKKTPARKPTKKTTKKTAPKQTMGEGNYEASRSFLKDQSDFVKRNQANIPAMGKSAEAALEGPEGDGLRAAEDEARSHSKE